MALDVEFLNPQSIGADGVHTKQVLVKINPADPEPENGWVQVTHGLKRIPDWVRVTPLCWGVPDESPSYADPQRCQPCISTLQSAADGKLVWDEGDTQAGGPPTQIDLTDKLWFGMNDEQAVTHWFLVEMGITYSRTK